MKIVMSSIKILAVLFLLILLWVVYVLITATINDYQPEEKITLYTKENTKLVEDSTFTFLIWNIGYSGLDKEMDFYYDGGNTVKHSLSQIQTNVENICQEIKTFSKTVDVFMLQEVDQHSQRSYFKNQFDSIAEQLDAYERFFGMNYDVGFVPSPTFPPQTPYWPPYGEVTSGIATFTKFQSTSSIRYSLPGNYSWPNNVFLLDRCLLVNRIPLANNKELIVINLHNSAYDDGTLKEQQLAYLKAILLEEYNKGNYVVAGGDWNQTPPNFNADKFVNEQTVFMHRPPVINSDFLPNWQWAFDPSIPSNRTLNMDFDAKRSHQRLIDFYLCSPNLIVQKINTIDQSFKYSDHQPVQLQVQLIQN